MSMSTDKDRRILRLAARLLRQELDYHGWQQMTETYNDLVVGLDQQDVEKFIEKVSAPGRTRARRRTR